MDITMNLSGIIGYPVTPFTNDGLIDLDALGKVIDVLLNSEVDAIAALGSAGEAAYLNEEEWKSVAEYTVKHVDGKVPVVIGIAELTTEKAFSKAIYANEIGADAIMLSPFSYYKLSEQEIFQHYQTVSEASPLPIMIYNNPATCGVDMSPEFMLKMVNKIPTATMIKESTGDIQRMHKIYALSNGQVPFFNGCNHLALEALSAGANGWCTAAPCLIGNKPKLLYSKIKNGELNEGARIFYEMYEFLEFIVVSGLSAAVKSGLQLKGINAGTPRKPLLLLPENKREQLEKMLIKLSS